MRLLLTLLLLFPLLASARPATWPPGTYGPYVLQNIRVIDGDTIEADILVWPGTTLREKVRIRGWDTPELRSKVPCEKELARRAREATQSAMKAARRVWLADVRGRDNFGRILGTVVVFLDSRMGFSLGAWLTQQGLARKWDARTRGEPWCGKAA